MHTQTSTTPRARTSTSVPLRVHHHYGPDRPRERTYVESLGQLGLGLVALAALLGELCAEVASALLYAPGLALGTRTDEHLT